MNGSYWWNGLPNPATEIHYPNMRYCAGIIGINRKCNDLYNGLNYFNCDERKIEHDILLLPDIDIFSGKNIFYLNIKTYSSAEITGFDAIYHNLKNYLLKFDMFSHSFKYAFRSEINRFFNVERVNSTPDGNYLFNTFFSKRCKSNMFSMEYSGKG